MVACSRAGARFSLINRNPWYGIIFLSRSLTRQSPPAVLRSAGAVPNRVRTLAGELDVGIRDAVQECAVEGRRHRREIRPVDRRASLPAGNREVRFRFGLFHDETVAEVEIHEIIGDLDHERLAPTLKIHETRSLQIGVEPRVAPRRAAAAV